MRVSVVIRNRNEAYRLSQALSALAVQTVGAEVLVVDNESDDESVEVAEQLGARVVSISRSGWSYGRALNRGLAQARGEIAVLLSAHSLPLGRRFLEGCLAPFEDPRVAATRCIYVGKGADRLRWIRPEILTAADDWLSRGPLASGCAIRRSVWRDIPFDEEVDAAEDKLWAKRALEAGHLIVSPCEAFYEYTRPLRAVDSVRKNYREIEAIRRVTGESVGFADLALTRSFSRFAHSILLRIPAAALDQLRAEWTRLALAVRSRMRRSEPGR